MHKILICLLFCKAALAATPESCGLAEGNVLPPGRHEAFEFSQSKMIGTISRPLQSSGLLGIGATGELLWQTRRPLKSTLVVGSGSIKVFNREDVLVNELSSPAIQRLLDLMLQIFNGDSAALQQSFAPTLTCADDGSWQVELRPVAADINELLLSVSLAGHDSIEMIRFREKRGDTTEIMLTPVPASRLEELESYLGD